MPDVSSPSEFLLTLNEIHPSLSFTVERQASLSWYGDYRKWSPTHTKVYVKATDTGLLLHYQNHVDVKYKHTLLKTMLNRPFKLSSNWHFFHQECERLKMVFARLHYPETLVENTIRYFNEMKVTENLCPKHNRMPHQNCLTVHWKTRNQQIR